MSANVTKSVSKVIGRVSTRTAREGWRVMSNNIENEAIYKIANLSMENDDQHNKYTA